MAIHAAANVSSFKADVIGTRRTVAPPLRWAKKSGDRSTCGHGKMGWSGISTNVEPGAFRKRIKAFE